MRAISWLRYPEVELLGHGTSDVDGARLHHRVLVLPRRPESVLRRARGQGAVKILLSNWSCPETSGRASWVKGESRRCPSWAFWGLRTLSTDVGSARRAERRGWRSPPGLLA